MCIRDSSLAHALNGEIVNGDALQLYRGIETITASPSKKDRDLIPHHLYGIADPCDTLNAGQYREMALPVLEDIRRRGKLAIVVGGSGLYLKFLTHGPDDLPQQLPRCVLNWKLSRSTSSTPVCARWTLTLLPVLTATMPVTFSVRWKSALPAVNRPHS